jgi:hypothetical protein
VHSMIPLTAHEIPKDAGHVDLNLESKFAHMRGMTFSVSVDGEQVCLAFPGVGIENGVPSLPGSIKFPIRLEPTLRFIADHNVFSLKELPGPLMEQSKIILAQRLLKESIIELI